MLKPFIDVIFITPLREEFDRLTELFPILEEFVEGAHFGATLSIPGTDLRAVGILQDSMGKAAASRATSLAISKYDVGVIIVIGIAGGLSGDVGLGDVCFTGPLFDVLENAKIVDGKKGISIEYNTIPHRTDELLTFSLKYVSLGGDIKGKFEDWQLDRYYKSKELIPGSFIGRNNINEEIGIPQIHDGSIVCGAVGKSDIYKSNIKTLDRKLLAIETETGGVFSEASRKNIPVVTIRGICDYADRNKTKLEEQTLGNARKVAADNAVSFANLQFFNPQFLKYLQYRRDHINGFSEEAARRKAADELVETTLSNLRDEVHVQLAQLSPDYRGKPKGYRLPLPRVKRSETNASITPTRERDDEINILEAVARNKISLLTVPRGYPDNGLPWILANEVSLVEFDGKSTVPVVFDGESIKPPQGTLQKHSSFDLQLIENRQDARLVFIISGISSSSKSRIDHLKTEMLKYPEAFLVLVNKTTSDAFDSAALQVGLGAQKYDLCEISFAELSSFIQRSFQYADQQASVVALRLQEMFRKFELKAHPTYFAGLSSDALISLLKANRRSELLQLAVSGFLSFVVAGDEDDIVLSRTTRETFLKQLVFQMHVQRKSFTRSQLVAFIDDFAHAYDFKIDSIKFLKAFIDKGILHFVDDRVQFSLPFVMSYLLASEMKNQPSLAIEYFNPLNDDFDFPTFDLYCEMAANEPLTTSLISALSTELAAFNPQKSNVHILLTNDIRPTFVDHPKRFSALKNQLQKAFDDVVSDRPNSEEKQRIIDVAGRVESGARQAHEAAELDKEDNPEIDRLNRLGATWTIALIALGSGAEQLTRDAKRRLVSLIVSASSTLLDVSLRNFPRDRFNEIKRVLRTDEVLRDVLGLDANEPIKAEQREFVDAMLEAYEYSMLGVPLRAVFGQLGNFAGQPVLLSSVSSLESEDLMENLVARIWAAEINATQEKSHLLRAIADLPPVPFLRHSLSTYFMTRVFWDHWETSKRLALLDAAEDSLKVLNSVIDKGKLQRLIQRGSDTDGDIY